MAPDGYTLSTDPNRVDLDLVHEWLSTDAYWALGRSRAKVEAAVANSLNFTVLDPQGRPAAYARIVTDRATFAWLCDVYVARDHRGRGIGTWLAGSVLAELRPYDIPRVLLATGDAHEVYRTVGFTEVPPDRYMIAEPRTTLWADQLGP